MTALQVLVDARALIDAPEKWAQGSSAIRGGRHSADTAIGTASLTNADAIAARIAIGFPIGSSDLWRWNDTPGRTHDDVMKLFDDAIARERTKP